MGINLTELRKKGILVMVVDKVEGLVVKSGEKKRWRVALVVIMAFGR